MEKNTEITSLSNIGKLHLQSLKVVSPNIQIQQSKDR